MYTRLRRLPNSELRRGACALLLLSFLATAVGVPDFRHESKQAGQPFPCQHHACGCVDADHCWRQCCCYTPHEKLAWARNHGVEPPEFAIADAGASPQRGPRSSQAAKSKAGVIVAGANSHDCCDSHQQTGNDQGPRRIRLAIGDVTRQCRGLAPLWSVLGAALPPPAAVTWDFQWDVVGWLQPVDSQAIAIATTPPVPPPRFGA